MKKPAELDFMRVCGLCGGVGWEGLEPSTNALKGRCSTIELPTRWRRGRLMRFARVAILKIIKFSGRDFTPPRFSKFLNASSVESMFPPCLEIFHCPPAQTNSRMRRLCGLQPPGCCDAFLLWSLCLAAQGSGERWNCLSRAWRGYLQYSQGHGTCLSGFSFA